MIFFNNINIGNMIKHFIDLYLLRNFSEFLVLLVFLIRSYVSSLLIKLLRKQQFHCYILL